MLVLDPWHWLAPDGSLPRDNPTLRKRVLRVARLIEYGGPLLPLEGRETLVECGKRLGRRRCPGLLWVVKTEEDEIHAFCAECRSDDSLIANWQSTRWADGPTPPVELHGGESEGRANDWGPN